MSHCRTVTCTRCGHRRVVRTDRPHEVCAACSSALRREGALPPRTPDERDDLAEAMVPVACQLAGAVRDDPDQVASILEEQAGNLDALAIVLAAMVPDDKPAVELLSWMRWNGEYHRLRDLGVDRTAAREVAREVA